MTRLILILALFAVAAQGQTAEGYLNLQSIAEQSRGYRSEWVVDSVAYEGYSGFKGFPSDADQHPQIQAGGIYGYEHRWLEKDETRVSVCAVNHGELGCPDSWRTYWRICKVCYRKERVREVRYLLPPTISAWDRANAMVDSLKRRK